MAEEAEKELNEGVAAGQPGTALLINVYRLVRRKAPSSLAIYPVENAPYSVAFIEESSTFSISHFAYARDKSGVASPRFPARYIVFPLQKNKTPYPKIRSFIFLTGGYLSFQAASSQVLSTYKGLTTVFGMGTGGSP